MKHYFLRALMALAALVAPAFVMAQSTATTVHIAEPFVVGGATLPAGDYRVSHDLGGGNEVLRLRGTASGATVFLLPRSTERPAEDSQAVTLVRIDGVNYLTEITTPSGVYHLAATPARDSKPGRSDAVGLK